MKRIKCEEIQNSIQNYVKQRNISNTNYLSKFGKEDLENKNNKNVNNEINNSNVVDLNLMALNDLALIESSINDYYSFSLNSLSETEYIKQFENLKNFIRQDVETNKKSSDLDQLLFPTFIYVCIDLSLIGYCIKNFINKNLHETQEFNLDSDQEILIENLMILSEKKDLNKCKLMNNWIENKCKIKVSSKSWNKFLKFLTESKSYLLLRIVNLNFQIILTNELIESDSTNQFQDHDVMINSLKLEVDNNNELFHLNNSNLKQNFLNIKSEKIEIDDNMNQQHFNYNHNQSSISLKSLSDCINKIKSQPSRINGTCCYYVDDVNNEITSSIISPNSEMIAYTTENASIYLYKLYEQSEFNKKDKFSQQKNSSLKIKSKHFQELLGGHSGTIFKSKFTHDSKYLLSCGDDGVACLWDINNQKNSSKESEINAENVDEYEENFNSKIKSSCFYDSPSTTSHVCSYSGHLYPVWDLEVFSRLNLFSTCSKDGTARLWSFDRTYPLRIYCGHQSDVNCVKFHPNGSYLATGSSDKTVRLWSVQSSEFVRLFSGHRSRVFAISFSPDGNYLASAGEDRKIKVWDLRSGGMLKELKGHNDFIHSLEFDNNSEILCSGGLDKTVKFWDVHLKNIALESSFKNNQSISKNLNNSFTSNELIKSINVDFNVYSINADVQNIFYINGAKKHLTTKNNEELEQNNVPLKNNNINSNNNNTITVNNQTDKNQVKIEKKLNTGKNTNNKISNNQKANSNANISTTSHSKSTNPISTSLNSNTSTTSNATNNSNSKITTRRRAAMASKNTNTSTSSNTSNQPTSSSSTFNFFSNNDDLYEV